MVLRPKPEQDWPAVLYESRHYPEKAFVPGCHIAGGFLFAAGQFVEDVPYDPRFYFHGEEHGLTLRAWTRGWNIVHPPVIPLYHLYKEPDKESTGHHWHPRWQRSAEELTGFQNRAKQRLEDLIAGRLTGVWGLGEDRTLASFAATFGVDYQNQNVTEPAYLQGKLQ